jgi:apoptosis-inducing factor 2
VRDRAVEVDGRRVKLDSGDWLEPDYLMLATGSWYPFPAKTEEPDIASARVGPQRGARRAVGGRPRRDRGRGPGLELGDLADAGRDMAGIATKQAGVVAANIQALITGEGELTSYETFPPMIAIPLGPEGGAGPLGEGVADAATIAEIKGRDMLLGHYAELFDSAPMPA